MPAQRGFHLIEVLVAVVVLSIGLLGIAALQVQGLRYNYGSFSRSQAVVIANDLAERIYANRPGAEAGGYAAFDSDDLDCDSPPSPQCGAENGASAAACTPTQMAQYDEFVAFCGLATASGRSGGAADLLTEGHLAIDCVDNTASAATITCAPGVRRRIVVSWSERALSVTGTSTVETASFPLVIQP
jgi:type IV pilus assembly protein PilV